MNEALREGEDCVAIARVEAPNQAVVEDTNFTFFASGGTGATAGSCELRIYDLSVPDNASENPVFEDLTLTANGVLTSALTLDGYWTRDDIGYSFLNILTSAGFALEGAHTYRLEYVLKEVVQTAGSIAHGDLYVDFEKTIAPHGSP